MARLPGGPSPGAGLRRSWCPLRRVCAASGQGERVTAGRESLPLDLESHSSLDDLQMLSGQPVRESGQAPIGRSCRRAPMNGWGKRTGVLGEVVRAARRGARGCSWPLLPRRWATRGPAAVGGRTVCGSPRTAGGTSIRWGGSMPSKAWMGWRLSRYGPGGAPSGAAQAAVAPAGGC